ncbi:DUF4328 domain-containing protein [Moraxella bovis]|uniref:DUF4328 domain-containing protein n=1 Tax=Moraxella bovis TaxID=476 RepID=UPI00222712C4|nr:DUF4328 domain-containing protein [Moraxella bovis]UYZ68460.1 DUF4328 domain-containing protein [Moraxella bovis]UYZ70831.1 DUF4328 domain-containing protein [Moraxella bovis]UYZ73242.1 DUF4328 domain-containing protein [Moraxella bovis]UZA14140.1 DUF4328 domain-containing protein [Moraxella bovis]UZA27507.1 DUF4328 domain-containing protein [Moraxella bovis]
MSKTPKTYAYRPTSGVGATVSSVAVILFLLADFVYSSYANWFFRQYVKIIDSGDDVALDLWASQNETLVQIGEWLYYGLLIVFVISAIFVAKWVYDSHCNARALGVSGIAYSPLMSAVVFFIPIANLFMPFIAMRDMVNGSFEKANKPTFHGLVLLWWVCFVGGTLLDRFYSRKMTALDHNFPNKPTAEQIIDYFAQMVNILSVLQISTVLTLISAVALIVIIKRTSRLHHQMYKEQQ